MIQIITDHRYDSYHQNIIVNKIIQKNLFYCLEFFDYQIFCRRYWKLHKSKVNQISLVHDDLILDIFIEVNVPKLGDKEYANIFIEKFVDVTSRENDHQI